MNKTIWVKIISIVLAGTFFCQSTAFARHYDTYDVLPEEDLSQAYIGAALTIGTACVPMAATAAGQMFHLGSQAATTAASTAIGIGMGAALGAAPGLIAHDNKAAGTGAILGGITGGIGSYLRTANINTLNTEASRVGLQTEFPGDFGRMADPSTTFGFGIGPGGPGSYNHAVNSAVTAIEQGNALLQTRDFMDASKKFFQAGENLNNAATNWQTHGLSGANKLGSLGKQCMNLSTAAYHFSPEQTLHNFGTSFAAQQASSTLASAATLCWGMEPKDAQFVGMVGGSVTGWSLGGLSDGGKDMLVDMYKDISPGFGNFARNHPVAAGAVTGLGLGSLQAAATINLYDKVFADDSTPESTRLQLSSLGGNLLGSWAWGGISGAFGNPKVYEDRFEPDYETYVESGGWNTDTQGWGPIPEQELHRKRGYGEAIDMVQREVGIANTGNGAASRAYDVYDTYSNSSVIQPRTPGVFSGIGKGVKITFVNRTPWRSIAQQAISIGISGMAEHNWVKDDMKPYEKHQMQTYASIAGDTGAMLLANLPLIPEGPKPEQARVLRENAESYNQRADSLRNDIKESNAFEGLLPKEFDMGPVARNARERQRNIWEDEADKWGVRAEKTTARTNTLDGWHTVSLREPTPITKNTAVDRVLEPVISGLSSLAINNLRKYKVLAVQGAGSDIERNDAALDLMMHDLTVMNVSNLTHAGVVSLFNQKGWNEGGNEFGQICLGKQGELYGGLLPFNNLGDHKLSPRSERDTWGGSTIYGAAQTNSGLWNFSGLSNFAAQAEMIQCAGGAWRLQMGRSMSEPFFARVSQTVSSPTGGAAVRQTIRSTEGLMFTTLKNTITPYGVERVYPNLALRLEVENQPLLGEINRWIQESSYPADSGKNEIVRFPGWYIGRNDIENNQTSDLKLQNKLTGMKYTLTPQIFQKLDVNKPFELVFPEYPFEIKQPEISRTPPTKEPIKMERHNPPIVPKKEVRVQPEKSPLTEPENKIGVIEEPIRIVSPSHSFGYPIEGANCFPEGIGPEDAGAQVTSSEPFTPYQAPVHKVSVEGATVFPKGDISNPGQQVTYPDSD